METFYNSVNSLEKHCKTVTHSACISNDSTCPHHLYSNHIEFTDILFDIIDQCSQIPSEYFKHITTKNHLCYQCSLRILHKTKYFQYFDIFANHETLVYNIEYAEELYA
eukprot:426997_1